MSEGLNKVMLIGNLGSDPELKGTTGDSVLRVRLATTEVYIDRDKEKQERTEWHNVVVWGKRAEALERILSKGHRIYVEGRIQSRSWDDKDGVKKYATDIVATEILLLGGGERDRDDRDDRRGGRHDRDRDREPSRGRPSDRDERRPARRDERDDRPASRSSARRDDVRRPVDDDDDIPF